MNLIDRKAIEMWRRECGESPQMRKYIFREEWELLCDLALKGLAVPPEGGKPELAALIKEGQAHMLGHLEAAKRDAVDAARYRWLNKQHNFLIHIEDGEHRQNHVRLRCGHPLDTWIDNCIADESSPQEER